MVLSIGWEMSERFRRRKIKRKLGKGRLGLSRHRRKAASIIEESRLNYTILRPASLNDRDEIDCATTQKGETFRNAKRHLAKR
jgi:hypothetical protein